MSVVVLVSDFQAPYHHKAAINALADYIQDAQPESVVGVGDEMDLPQVSRWCKGTAMEFAATIGKHRDVGVEVLRQLCITEVSRSNHGDRLENYLNRYAPGLVGLPELTYPEFMRLDELGIIYHRSPWEIAPGWYCFHGDESGLNQTAGGTALGIARKVGKSVAAGHTHKLGLQHHTEMLNGRASRTLWGFETGNLMDSKKAGYVKSGANWVLGFGLLRVDGKHVTPIPVPVRADGTFSVDGKVYGA